MKIRSKSGEAIIIALVIGGLALIALPFMTPRHRLKLATKACLAKEPKGTDCLAYAKMLQADGKLSGSKPEYIRDK